MKHAVALLVVIVSVNVSYAHYLFLLPGSATAVFADTPTPDAKVDTGRLDGMTVHADGQAVSLKASGPGVLAPADGRSWRNASASVTYGVVGYGEKDSALVVYHAKAGDGSAGLPLELVAIADGTTVRFAVKRDGKPAANVDVVVSVPGETRVRAVTTDPAGRTPAFTVAGRYSARVRAVEPTPGEFQGKAYQQVRRYSTIVYDRP